MATSKKTAPKKASATKTAVTKAATKTVTTETPLKPIKTALKKNALVAAVAQRGGVDPKIARKLFTALEDVILASVSKKGAGVFVLPGLLKVTAVKIPAKPQRKGLNRLTGLEQVFKAKPATIRLRLRGLKKLKDAAL